MTEEHEPTVPIEQPVPHPAEEVEAEQGWVPWLVWTMIVCGTILGIGLVKVSTRLGVKATPWSDRGRDYVWRIWIRGSRDLVTTSHQWVVTTALIILLILFLAGCAVALYVALVHEDAPHD